MRSLTVLSSLVLSSSFLLAETVSASVTYSYSTGFESPDYTTGFLVPQAGPGQAGWSGGSVPGAVNNNVGDEQIVTGVSASGSQSWHYARGYGSPGSGTPFSPNLTAGASAIGDTFSGSLKFKAHTAGDGSSLAIETGNLAGNDRSEIIAYIHNTPTGLNVETFSYPQSAPLDGYSTVSVAPGLSTSAWHTLAFEVTRTATGNSLELSVDGGSPVTVEAYLAEWRDRQLTPSPYAESSRLKFRDRGGDNAAHNGFYIDDVSYVAVVPEPATLGLLGLGGLLLGRRRR